MTTKMSKPTVLVLSTSSGPGGAERVISTLSSVMNGDKCRVIVALFRPGWLQTECERLGVKTHVIPLSGPLHARWFLDCFRLIRREHVQLIHAHEFSALLCGWLLSILARVPLVGTIHGKNYFWEKRRRRLACHVVARTGRLIAVSEDLKRFIMTSVGIPGSRIQVIYNGVLRSKSGSQAEINRCRAELDIKVDDLVIGTVGSLYPVKGHQYLLQAMPAVLARFPNTILILAGTGHLEVRLKEMAQALGIKKHVRFLGMRDDVSVLLALMQVFVLPSLSEGLSMAVLEAMMAGKAVVATHVGGNPELVEDGATGLLVKPEDPADVAAKLNSILADRSMVRRFGEAGLQRATLHFTLERMAYQYKELYGALLGAAIQGRT
jgi:glycosyltransferase involved in cell wall biosynthesis